MVKSFQMTDYRKHPVDVLKDCYEMAGLKPNPEILTEMRAYCDEPVEFTVEPIGETGYRMLFPESLSLSNNDSIVIDYSDFEPTAVKVVRSKVT